MALGDIPADMVGTSVDGLVDLWKEDTTWATDMTAPPRHRLSGLSA